MSLTGKKILLTGANGGLGRAIATLAAKQGAYLALAEKTPALAASALSALADGHQACAVAADLADDEATAAMVAQAIDEMMYGKSST